MFKSSKYNVLTQQEYSLNDFQIIPVRYEDRYEIMNWRNEQIDILRQKLPLTRLEQDDYFKSVVANLFIEETPNQLIFSLLNRGELVGYGGLVHIDWDSKHAEISFLLKTKLNNKEYYLASAADFFTMMKKVGSNAGLNKVYTYGYDTADYRFKPLYTNGFILEAYLHEHVVVNGEKKAVRIYSNFLQND